MTRQIKDMYEKNKSLANLSYRVSATDLSENELQIIKAQTEVLLQQFLLTSILLIKN